ncbi:ABC transporter substrate-binding protein [Uliginosibacterium aquaticum]|uniref:Amino acid ABC transporter substrate-binding protein n=1 Tax=Uliginosibacterium aquaticum TaxID=2731212 RepID=A0ABX2IH81_9RHOO|nr:ABC transporter substrate-binding protein [Uliginosibacterium aquaticum]NSL56105.1 amino acid ABC transporter substrate-binding protein [Uliginosibacterium aquaticum]
MRAIHTFALALGLVCAATGVQARDWAAVKQSGTLIAASEGAYPPFNYFQGSRLTGYEIDVMEAVAKKLGLKLEWRALAFDALIASIRQDRFDVAIASHGYTEERAKSVDFTTPHYCSGGQIVAKAGGPLKATELTGKTLGVQLATTYAEAAKKVSGAKEVKTYPKDTDALQALLGGRVDAWITDRFVAKNALAKNSAEGIKGGDMVFVERVSMIHRKGNNELHEQLNKGLAAIKADGTLKAISEKYFQEDISCTN